MKRILLTTIACLACLCGGYVLGVTRIKWSGYRPTDILMISDEILKSAPKGDNKCLTRLRVANAALTNYLYFWPESYNYRYDQGETVSMLSEPMENELCYVERLVRAGGKVPDYLFYHMRGYMRSHPSSDPSDERGVKLEGVGMAMLIKKYRALDGQGYERLVKDADKDEYMAAVQRILKNLDDEWTKPRAKRDAEKKAEEKTDMPLRYKPIDRDNALKLSTEMRRRNAEINVNSD